MARQMEADDDDGVDLDDFHDRYESERAVRRARYAGSVRDLDYFTF